MKKIAVINDLSGFGRCSLTAAIPIISVSGSECSPLPTAILSNQTGYESFYCDDYTDKIDFFTSEWKKLNK
ncbi:MAG: pyridoxine kinase, partial [Oscillospiraceae bacterium]